MKPLTRAQLKAEREASRERQRERDESLRPIRFPLDSKTDDDGRVWTKRRAQS